MGEFALPTNIRQIGSIGDGLRIYMEDYVFTYLTQFAESGGYEERAAYLVGRYMVIDGQRVLFINGAVQGKDMDLRDGLLLFTEKSADYAATMIKEYFSGMEIVGWMQSQPSYGVYLNQQYGAYHRHVFPKDYHVMFVMDPLEKTNSFYAYVPEREAMQEVRGYFIYYDKNKNMHEYMLHDRAADKLPTPSAYVEVFGEGDGVKHASGPDRSSGIESLSPEESAARTEELIRRRADERTRKRSSAIAQRRSLNLMAGLSAALFVVCFVMGAGLLQNRDRISEMETQVTQLNTAYRNLLQGGVAEVFAQDELPAEPVDASQPPADTPINLSPATDTTQTTVLPEVPADTVQPQDLTETEASAQTEVLTNQPDITPAPSAEEPLPEEPKDTLPAETQENTPAEVFVPEEDTVSADASVPEAYTIQPGDSLMAISLQFYGTANKVDEILALNGLVNADKIVSGKTIALPRP